MFVILLKRVNMYTRCVLNSWIITYFGMNVSCIRCMCMAMIRLKYCQNKDGEGEHRCGIRTCKKGITYHWATLSRFCIDMHNEDEV